METRKCIACNGKGVIPNPPHKTKITKAMREQVLKLYRSGATYREIAKKVGIKSPSSIQWIIKSCNL